MNEPAIIVVRLLQYASAAILGGTALFHFYAAPSLWPRTLLALAAVVLAVSSFAAVGLWAAQFGGTSLRESFAFEPMAQIVAFLAVGKGAFARLAVGVAALIALLVAPGRGGRRFVAVMGLTGIASLAWLGHAAAAEDWTQLIADLVHCLAAGIWLGALVGLAVMAFGRADQRALATALQRFSVIGVAVVGMLAATGLINVWYLVGIDRLGLVPATPYGQLLIAKLAVFAAMLGFAALNRWRVGPALLGGRASIAQVRRSVLFEAALGLVVLALVAWLGTLEPPAAL